MKNEVTKYSPEEIQEVLVKLVGKRKLPLNSFAYTVDVTPTAAKDWLTYGRTPTLGSMGKIVEGLRLNRTEWQQLMKVYRPYLYVLAAKKEAERKYDRLAHLR